MANYFVINAGKKHGPFDDQQLKALAAKGRITPTTTLETDSGHQRQASQIEGLFSESPGQILPVQMVQVAPPAPKELFCTNCGNSVSAQAVACMSCGAKPIGHKKFCRQCGTGLNLEQIVCVKCGANLNTGGLAQLTGGVAPQATTPLSKSLNTYFMAYWIALAVCIIVPIPVVGWIGTFIASIVCVVVKSKLLYQCWKLIPADIARTTPGKAVGFLFIPIFHFYWMFVAYMGLCEDLNKTLQQRGIQFEVNKTMGMVYCILYLACLIPILNILAIIGVSIVSVILLYSLKNGAIALLEQGG